MVLRIETYTRRPTLLGEERTHFLKPTWDQTPAWKHKEEELYGLSLSLSHKLKNQDPFCFLQCTCLLQSNITVFVVVQFLFITDLLSHSPYSSLSPSCFSCPLLNFISEFILRNPFGLQYLSFLFFPSEYCKCLLISSFTLIYTKQVSS